MNSYKFLMHPVRLAISKVLFDNPEFTAPDLKKAIGVKTSDFNNHLKSMADKNFLELEKSFVNGKLTQIVRLTPYALKQFEKLKDILVSLQTDPEFDNYVEFTTGKAAKSKNRSLET